MSTRAAGSPSSVLPPVVAALMREIVAADAGPDLLDNVDPLRFGDDQSGLPPAGAPGRLAELVREGPGLQALFEQLDEPADRALLVRVLAFRVLGHRKVRLDLTVDRLHELRDRAYALRVAEHTAPNGILDWQTDDYDLTALGYPILLRANVGAVLHTFQLEQYRCPGEPDIAVEPGDVVIDGGSYWGDTALYFAHLAGPAGRVVGFEFEPSNLEGLGRNLALNPELAARIDVVRAALWDHAGAQVSVRAFGPGTHITEHGETHAPTDTIDALVDRGGADRVDFIKLDIEGSELNALRGAGDTLRRFRPRLAIAAYHRADDLAAIPAHLSGLGLGYRFRIGHTTMHAEETVLFATPDAVGANPG